MLITLYFCPNSVQNTFPPMFNSLAFFAKIQLNPATTRAQLVKEKETVSYRKSESSIGLMHAGTRNTITVYFDAFEV